MTKPSPFRSDMIDGETDRFVAWGAELRRIDGRLRDALRVTRAAVAAGSATDVATRELILFRHGFCAALTVHHRGEDSDSSPRSWRTVPTRGRRCGSWCRTTR